MENQNNREEQFEKTMRRIGAIGLCVLYGVSVIAAIYCHRQMKKTFRLASKASDNVADLVVVDVQQMQGKIQKAVADTIAREATKVDQSAIMEEATEKAKEMLLERFDSKPDGL